MSQTEAINQENGQKDQKLTIDDFIQDEIESSTEGIDGMVKKLENILQEDEVVCRHSN